MKCHAELKRRRGMRASVATAGGLSPLRSVILQSEESLSRSVLASSHSEIFRCAQDDNQICFISAAKIIYVFL